MTYDNYHSSADLKKQRDLFTVDEEAPSDSERQSNGGASSPKKTDQKSGGGDEGGTGDSSPLVTKLPGASTQDQAAAAAQGDTSHNTSMSGFSTITNDSSSSPFSHQQQQLSSPSGATKSALASAAASSLASACTDIIQMDEDSSLNYMTDDERALELARKAKLHEESGGKSNHDVLGSSPSTATTTGQSQSYPRNEQMKEYIRIETKAVEFNNIIRASLRETNMQIPRALDALKRLCGLNWTFTSCVRLNEVLYTVVKCTKLNKSKEIKDAANQLIEKFLEHFPPTHSYPNFCEHYYTKVLRMEEIKEQINEDYKDSSILEREIRVVRQLLSENEWGEVIIPSPGGLDSSSSYVSPVPKDEALVKKYDWIRRLLIKL